MTDSAQTTVACDCTHCKGATAPVTERRLKQISKWEPERRDRLVHQLVCSEIYRQTGNMTSVIADSMLTPEQLEESNRLAALAPPFSERQKDQIRALFALTRKEMAEKAAREKGGKSSK